MAKTVPNSDATQSTTDPCEPPPSKKKKSSQLLNYIFSQTESMPREGDTIEDEITAYLSCLSESDEPLEFWKEHESTYPTLGKLAHNIVSIPASSGPIE